MVEKKKSMEDFRRLEKVGDYFVLHKGDSDFKEVESYAKSKFSKEELKKAWNDLNVRHDNASHKLKQQKDKLAGIAGLDEETHKETIEQQCKKTPYDKDAVFKAHLLQAAKLGYFNQYVAAKNEIDALESELLFVGKEKAMIRMVLPEVLRG